MTNLKKRPVLISLTSPTCAGKTTLQETLIEYGIPKILSTTTRARRNGEVDGKDYIFITEDESIRMEKNDEFAELISFLGVRYGVPRGEMIGKLSGDNLATVILEPNGVSIYEKIVPQYDALMFKVFIHTPTDMRLDRLKQRFKNDLASVRTAAEVDKTIDSYFRRTVTAVTEEQKWSQRHHYDLTVFGDQPVEDLASRIIKEVKKFQAQDLEVREWKATNPRYKAWT